MNKISGILPSNNRITSVDLKDSQPLRSGHEARFGQQASISEVRRSAAPKLTLNEAPNAYTQLSERKMKDRAHAAIVEQMSNSFFRKEKPVEETLNPMLEETFEESKTIDRFELNNTQSPRISRPVIEERNYVDEYVDAEDYGPFALESESFDTNVATEESAPSSFNTVGANLSVVA